MHKSQTIFFVQEIKLIRESFTFNKVNPIDILSELIPRIESEFSIPLINISETNMLIRGLKNTNSVGCDNLSNKIIKKMGPNIAPHIMWLINNCIQKGVVPDILKVSRILPISKPGKDLTSIESYRPINNLPIIEKNLETHVLKHFNTFLEKN